MLASPQVGLHSTGGPNGRSNGGLVVGGQTSDQDKLQMKQKQHIEDMKKRRLLDQEKALEDEFLRTSLRGSERLRALERAKKISGGLAVKTTGLENEAFLDEEDEMRDGCDSSGMKPILPLVEVSDLLNNLQAYPELAQKVSSSDWSLLNQFLSSSHFNRAYLLHDTVSEALESHRQATPLSAASLEQLALVRSLLNDSSVGREWTNQNRELAQLLNSPEIGNLMQAHDQVAEQLAPMITRGTPLPAVKAVRSHQHPTSPKQKKRAPTPPPTYTVDDGDVDVEVDTLPGRRAGMQYDDEEEEEKVETGEVFNSSEPGCYATVTRSPEGILLKTVVLQKGEEALGATVRNEGNSVVIGRIVVGGIAHKSGLLCEGDEVLSVNEIDMLGKDVNVVSDTLGRMTGEVVFIVVPVDDGYTLMDERRDILYHLRALFTYHPDDDLYIPCREIGLGFEKGDILHVTSTRDPNWWQAYRDGEDVRGSSGSAQLAGLIPSPEFQQQRELLRKKNELEMEDEMDSQRHKKGPLCLQRKKHYRRHNVNGVDHGESGRSWNRKRKGRRNYFPSNVEDTDVDTEDIHTYEQVDSYYPQPHRKRPIVLVGPPQVGRRELLHKLIESDIDRFSPVIPYTTRTLGPGDVDGEEFQFISKTEFQSMMDDNQLVEHGKFEKHLYGTGRESIQTVINSGKVCVLCLQAESLKAMRATNFLPYVIFIAPPNNIDPLRNLRTKLNDGVRPSDEELLKTLELGHEMEEKFGHLFDHIIVNNDLDRSFNQLLDEIQRLEIEPQWVPKTWLCLIHSHYNSSHFEEREVDEIKS